MILWIKLCIWVDKVWVNWNYEIHNHFFKIESFAWQSHLDCWFEPAAIDLSVSNYLDSIKQYSLVTGMMDAHYNGGSNLRLISAILEN